MKFLTQNNTLPNNIKSKNLLIHGENSIALEQLKKQFSNKIKCIFIDPPYGTGKTFSHYNDGAHHGKWLDFIISRIETAKDLMIEDGTLWVTIGDKKAHYLKVELDKLFFRKGYLGSVIWQKKPGIQSDAKFFSTDHDHILVYAKCKEKAHFNRLERPERMNKKFRNPDNDPRGKWSVSSLTTSGYYEKQKTVVFNNGFVWRPSKNRYLIYSPETIKKMESDDLIWFGKDGKSIPRKKIFLSDSIKKGVPSRSVWLHKDVGSTADAKREVASINGLNIFDTPKPEKLMQKILTIATDPGDYVLDFFAGSGTTGAVANKMNRQWIMVELGDQCKTHIVPRLAGGDYGYYQI